VSEYRRAEVIGVDACKLDKAEMLVEDDMQIESSF